MRTVYSEAEQAAARALARQRYPPREGRVGLGLSSQQWMKLTAEVRSGARKEG
jgi:hypothetical protein